MGKKPTYSYLESLAKQGLFYQKKQRVYKPKIGLIDIEHNSHGHIFNQVGYIKPTGKHLTISRIWQCSQCGLLGIQHGLFESPKIQLVALKYRVKPITEDDNVRLLTDFKRISYVDVSCPEDSSMLQALMQPQGMVRITSRSVEQFGLSVGDVVKIVRCPDEYGLKYGMDVWVHSPTRNEPCRLLKGEYCLVEEGCTTDIVRQPSTYKIPETKEVLEKFNLGSAKEEESHEG